MTSFRHLPLGTRIPDRLHAVSCSLPTMRDVIGYEEKKSVTVAQMTSGYPRFVVHPLLGAIEAEWRRRFDVPTGILWITSSERMARMVGDALAPAPSRVLAHDGVYGVAHADEPDLRAHAKALLQHTGGFLSSRAAEDYVLRQGLSSMREEEATLAGDAERALRETLAPLYAPVDPRDIRFAPSGMNAFWAAFRAVSEQQRPLGRDTWLQIGWLYLDTAAILSKFTRERHVHVFDVHDRAAIEAAFREHGPRLAGVVTEVTTNPLMHTADVPWLARMARDCGARFLVDPSIVSPWCVDVVPHADIVINSLTKYAAAEGDVIAGAVVVTDRCPEREATLDGITRELEPVHPRDLARLAYQAPNYGPLLETLNARARAVVEHLRTRTNGVRRLYWSLQDESREHYLALARTPDRIGPVVSFEVEGSMQRFYDAVPIAKGPSFGMRTSLLCPFVYLAHYDLVTSEAGRSKLAAARLPAELLRLSVGDEPVEDIVAALEIGFAAAAG
jgi:cystathionine gamma-synthase